MFVKTSKRKKASERYVKMVETLKDAIIKKEIDEKS